MTERFFTFGENTVAVADERLNNPTMKTFWNGFCSRLGAIAFQKGDRNTFRLGTAEFPVLEEDEEYALSVSETGVSVCSRDYPGLAHGFMALLQKIESVCFSEGKPEFRLPCGEYHGKYQVKVRMIHFCVFPETTLAFLQKCIRLAGVMQYTHVILEFWGMLKLDCLRELAWKEGYTKEQVRPLISEIREMGMEPVPMFNHLGHASGCRMNSGKHVVLDQNLSLERLFLPDGWSWNIRSDETRSLLRKIRSELYELFGEGTYFHAGFDEAYMFVHQEKLRNCLPEYFHFLTQEIKSEGRTPILWGDMLLNSNRFNVPDGESYYCFCKDDTTAETLAEALAQDTVIADWQYNVRKETFASSRFFKEHHFSVLATPWYDMENETSAVKTAEQLALTGVMLTTWHTLKTETASILKFAYLCGASGVSWSAFSGGAENAPLAHESGLLETAALLRKISPPKREYSECGWTAEQIEY